MSTEDPGGSSLDPSSTDRLPEPDGPRVSQFMVRVAVGPRADRAIIVPLLAPAIIGSDAACNIVLEDGTVSRRHAKLSPTSDGVVVEDLGSTNGITYQGHRIERGLLRAGARLNLGRCTLEISAVLDQDSEPASDRSSYGPLVGHSLPMRRLYAYLEALEQSDAAVLIEGETGTGKELVARALHQHGARKDKPLVVVDATCLPHDLVESELFGHKKGAFTGAVADRLGAFQRAAGGTLFIDEIAELPLDLQPKLLRALESGEVKAVGDAEYHRVDFRLISATHRDLSARVRDGTFRQDLFFRLAVIRVPLAPLRERREDIPMLVEHLAQQLSLGQLHGVPPGAAEFFLHYDWPGNVRELRNAVHRVLTMGATSAGLPQWAKDAEGLPREGEVPSSFFEARDRALRSFEFSYLRHLLEREKSIAAAARAAGMDRKQLRELLKKHELY